MAKVAFLGLGVMGYPMARHLKAKGHEVRIGGRQGDAHSIWVAPDGTPYGVNDRRTPDSKVSVPQQLTAPATRR